jgi:hypothetical protein
MVLGKGPAEPYQHFYPEPEPQNIDASPRHWYNQRQRYLPIPVNYDAYVFLSMVSNR